MEKDTDLPPAAGRGSSFLLPPITFTTPAALVNDTELLNSNSTSGLVPSLKDSELISLVVVGLLGLAGTIMNIGVLTIVYKGRLVKKDYRMLYYISITMGDLFFAIHTVLNSLSILYRDLYVFRMFAVCINIHVTLGVASYQWSAMCIVLLIIDLIVSLKRPFSDDKTKRTFSKIGSVSTFTLGLFLSLAPFIIYQDDIPTVLPFCSIANVYGSRWSMYQIEAATMLSILFSMMLGAGSYLLYIIYRTHHQKQVSDTKLHHKISRWIDEEKDSVGKPPRLADKEADLQPEDFPVRLSPHPKKKHRVISNQQSEAVKTVSSKVIDICDENIQASEHCVHPVGVDNDAFVHENNIEVNIGSDSAKAQPKAEVSDDHEHLSKRDIQRKQFYSACRNVAAFMGTYLGSCLPYYVYIIATLDCAPDCYQDTPQQRGIRVVVATFLYMLPIIDPILYTQRFAIFKEAAMDTFKPCINCFRRSSIDDM